MVLSRRLMAFGVIALGACGVVAFFILRNAGDGSAPRFETSSDKLSRTIIVPTLDTPVPKEKSAIWCGSFSLAWRELESSVVGEPIRLAGAEDVADRLNKEPFSSGDLEPTMYYAAAGLTRDGIVPRIQKEMRQRFPDVQLPALASPDDVAIAYAYLETSIKFPIPYLDETIVFTDSSGNRTNVEAFGIDVKDLARARQLEKQVDVLFADDGRRDANEFALDLFKNSTPNQIVVARVPLRGSLAETYQSLQIRIKKEAQKPKTFSGDLDRLRVPRMHWKIDHHFAELQGKKFKNDSVNALYLEEVVQTISFKLDSKGAEVKSDARMRAKALPSITSWTDRFCST
jgi:hypothetical protein